MKKFALIFGFLAFLGSAVGMLKQVIPFEVQRLLPTSHPIRMAYEDYLTRYDDGRTSYVLATRTQGAFSEPEIYEVSEAIELFLKNDVSVRELTSPSSAKYFAHEGAFELRKFFDQGRITPEGARRLESELWKESLMSGDRTSLLVKFNLSPELPTREEAPFVDRLRAELSRISARFPGVELHPIGPKIASAAFLREMQFNLFVITPLILVVLGLFLYFLYRSWQILAWNYVVMFICYVSTLMMIIAVEGGLGPYSNFALMFSFIVATSDLIHFFCRFQRLEGTVEERLKEAVRISYVPCLLTSLTTSAGFAALIINQNLPIRYFGLYCAFSCMLEWVVIFYLLPYAMRVFGFNAPVRRPSLEGPVKRYVSILKRHSVSISIGSILLVMLGALGTRALSVDDNFYTKFKAHHWLSQSVHAFAQRFNFVGSVDLLIRPEGDPASAQNLDRVRVLERRISGHRGVARIASFRQVMDELSARVPEARTRESIFRILNDYGSLREVWSEPARELRTVVFLKSLSTSEFQEVYRFLEALKGDFPELRLEISGFAAIRNFVNSRVIRDLLESFVLSFALTYLCFIYLYRSLGWALAALFPNLIPLLMITGLMGVLGTPVDSNLVILICVAFGISGDNTMHLTYVLQALSKSRETGERRGIEHLGQAVQFVGIPIVATSLVFLVVLPCFMLGNLRLFDQMALFLSVAFLMALLADLVSFPAFQVWMSSGSKRRK